LGDDYEHARAVPKAASTPAEREPAASGQAGDNSKPALFTLLLRCIAAAAGWASSATT